MNNQLMKIEKFKENLETKPVKEVGKVFASINCAIMQVGYEITIDNNSPLGPRRENDNLEDEPEINEILAREMRHGLIACNVNLYPGYIASKDLYYRTPILLYGDSYPKYVNSTILEVLENLNPIETRATEHKLRRSCIEAPLRVIHLLTRKNTSIEQGNIVTTARPDQSKCCYLTIKKESKKKMKIIWSNVGLIICDLIFVKSTLGYISIIQGIKDVKVDNPLRQQEYLDVFGNDVLLESLGDEIYDDVFSSTIKVDDFIYFTADFLPFFNEMIYNTDGVGERKGRLLDEGFESRLIKYNKTRSIKCITIPYFFDCDQSPIMSFIFTPEKELKHREDEPTRVPPVL